MCYLVSQHAVHSRRQEVPSHCRWGYRYGVLPWSSSCWSSGGLAAGTASRRGPGLCRPAGAAAGTRTHFLSQVLQNQLMFEDTFVTLSKK